MSRVRFFLLILGCYFMFTGYEEYQLLGVAKVEAQGITAEKLASVGYGDNAHIILEEFLCPDYFVYEEKSNGDYSTVWVPAVPLDGEYHQRWQQHIAEEEAGNDPGKLGPPKTIGLIIQSSERIDDAQVGYLMDAETLQGLVINEIESLDSETKSLLRDAFPSLNFDKVLIMEEDRSPTTQAGVLGRAIGGLLSILLGLALLLFRRSS